MKKKRKTPAFKRTASEPLKKETKDQQQDREIKRLKSMIKVNKPPVKSTYAEGVVSPDNSWVACAFNYPAKGGAEDERLNAEIILKSINVRFTLSVSETDDFDTMRVIIVQYMDGNEVANYPLNHDSNLWLSPTTGYPMLSPYNTQSASTYRVLYDKAFNLNENGVAQVTENVLITAKQIAQVNGITRLKFDTDAGLGLPGLDRGIILMWVCSDSTASPNPSIEFSVKMNFIDT